MKGDSPTELCERWCIETYGWDGHEHDNVSPHCKWCKCAACLFCPSRGPSAAIRARWPTRDAERLVVRGAVEREQRKRTSIAAAEAHAAIAALGGDAKTAEAALAQLRRELSDQSAEGEALRREFDMLKAGSKPGKGLDVASALAVSRAARSVGVAEKRVRVADNKTARALDAAQAAEAACAALSADCLLAQGRAGRLGARLQSDRAVQRDAPPPDAALLDELVTVKLQLAQSSQLEAELARVRAQLAEARAGHDYAKPAEKASKRKFFGRSSKS